jgi:cytochrome bd ubiquinol oxidase subunit II
MNEYGGLEILWFCVIAGLWVGYFFLEGFDFGVGMLLCWVGRDRAERRAVIHTIGPVWDGNEVWLIVAAGATFAAFPEWYATLFSGFYVLLFLLVIGLVLRPVALELWGKGGDRWRARWEWALLAGSALPAFLWGVVFANVVRGVPIDRDMELTGSLLDLVHPYALLGGVTTLLLCLAHGAAFLVLKTEGEVHARARRAARLLSPAGAVSLVAFVAWTLANHAEPASLVAGLGACVLASSVPLLGRRSGGWAFAANGAAIALVFVMLFADLYPNVLVSSTDDAFNLTLGNAASGSYTLTVITVVAAIMVPAVVVCQVWTYWVFRKRVGSAEFEAA